jgi:hypothetical protein
MVDQSMSPSKQPDREFSFVQYICFDANLASHSVSQNIFLVYKHVKYDKTWGKTTYICL